MVNFNGKVIVKENRIGGKFDYEVIENPLGHKEARCIIVKTLNSDYSLLLGKVDMIISERGSPLSHLAIIAREYNKTIVLVEEIADEIPKKGTLSITHENEDAKIQIT